MFRRSIVILVAAAALALAPAAAFGYGAGDYSNKGTVSDTTPDIGQQFTVTAAGPSNTNVTLTITSAPSIPVSTMTKATSATGAVSFAVTLNAAGTYTLVLTDTATGAVLSSQVVTVAAAAAATVAAGLASTGSNFALFGLTAGALIVLGTGAIVVARRRQGHSA